MDQPRQPAGVPEGGQFASIDGTQAQLLYDDVKPFIHSVLGFDRRAAESGSNTTYEQLSSNVGSYGGYSSESLDILLSSAVGHGDLKQETVDKFYKAVEGLERHKVNTDTEFYDKRRTYFADGWKTSSTSAESTSLKHAVEEELGSSAMVYDPDDHGHSKLEVIQAKAMAARMYRETQAEIMEKIRETASMPHKRPPFRDALSDAGFHVGAELDPHDNSRLILHRGTDRPVTMHGVLEAWSGSKDQAENFGPLASDNGVVVTKSIPAKDILVWYRGSAWRSKGQASQDEREFIVIHREQKGNLGQ